MTTPTSPRTQFEIAPTSDPNPTSTGRLNRTVSSSYIYAPSKLTVALGLLTGALASTSIALSIVGINCLQGGKSYPFFSQDFLLYNCSNPNFTQMRRLTIPDCTKRYLTPQERGSMLLTEAQYFGVFSILLFGFTSISYGQDLAEARRPTQFHPQNEV